MIKFGVNENVLPLQMNQLPRKKKKENMERYNFMTLDSE